MQEKHYQDYGIERTVNDLENYLITIDVIRYNEPVYSLILYTNQSSIVLKRLRIHEQIPRTEFDIELLLDFEKYLNAK